MTWRPPSASRPRWAAAVAVPDTIALRAGALPVLVVAPHGGRRSRAIRAGDSVNDLHTAEIAWEIAERAGAHAIVNHGIDRNDVDLNRISHLTGRARDVLELMGAAIADLRAGGATPLVLFVHGWNMVVPCCDIGIGLRRSRGILTGRYPTISEACYERTIRTVERELAVRGVTSAIGRRYTASGRDNAAQLFSGRHAGHDDSIVRALAELASAGRVDAAQLELGIPLRWPGALRDALVDGVVAAIRRSTSMDAGGPVSPRSAWRLEASSPKTESIAHEAGYGLQALVRAGDLARPLNDRDDVARPLNDRDDVAIFCGVEPTGPDSMAARFSIVSTDGSMMLLVGEGPWNGVAGHYNLEGFTWHAHGDGNAITIRLRAPMIRYPTHDAYLDLERGLASSALVDADISLSFERRADGHGRLRGVVRAGSVRASVDTLAFVDRGGRRAEPRERIRISVARGDADVVVLRSDASEPPANLVLAESEDGLGEIRSAASPIDAVFDRAAIVARVPVWRPNADGSFSRWSFGIASCRFRDEAEERRGLFETVEVFARRLREPD